LLNQTDLDFEIVLIDNASRDGSINKAEELIRNNNFKTYKVVRIEYNTGCGQGRTAGYQNATGYYVNNLDSDDTLPTFFVEKIKNTIDEYSPDIISYGHDIVDENDNLIRIFKPYNDEIFTKYNLTMFWRYTFRKEIAFNANVNTSGMHYAEDRIFSLRLIPYIADVKNIDEQMYKYYKNTESTSSIIDQVKYKDSNVLVFNEYSKILKQLNNKHEIICLKYAINKFYISILAKNCKGKKNLINKYFIFYKECYLSALQYDRYKDFWIIPKNNLCKETLVIQISYLLLKFKLNFLFRLIYTMLY
jgi:glycosyltransferase involved in cell wall biosynthesis